MIMTKKQAEDYADWLKVLASGAEHLASEVMRCYEYEEPTKEFNECKKEFRNRIEDLEEFERQNGWR